MTSGTGTSGAGTSTAAIDLAETLVRALNAELHRPTAAAYEVVNPRGAHAVAAGLRDPITVEVRGHVGYYCAGMNQHATVVVHGNAGVGVAENMMSGLVRVGRRLPVRGRHRARRPAGRRGSARWRCAISLKGADVVVGGDVTDERLHGAGRAARGVRRRGESLDDSIYEARLRPGHRRLAGCDCVEKEMRADHRAELADLLAAAGLEHDTQLDPGDFRRYGSARRLYHFTSGNTY